MALVNCPECSAQISDRAAFCPHCGLPMALPKNELKKPVKKVKPETSKTAKWIWQHKETDRPEIESIRRVSARNRVHAGWIAGTAKGHRLRERLVFRFRPFVGLARRNLSTGAGSGI